MKVVVCLLAQAASPPGSPINRRTDSSALGHALALAGRGGPGQPAVTALLAGTAAQEGPLAHALSAGADRAVRLAGEDLVNADLHCVGQVLASGIKRLGADLVLFGTTGDDGSLAGIPASTARQLGFVQVSGVEELAIASDSPDGPAVDVLVRGGGRARRLRVTLPALLSVAAGPSGPTPTPGAATGARNVELLSLADPERTVVRRRTELLGKPEPASRPTETAASAAALIAALVRR